MPLPLLAFMGLGLGANFGLNKLAQGQETQRRGLLDQQAQNLFYGQPQESAGPTQSGQPLMSRGPSLMGGQVPPTEAAQRLIQMDPEGPYGKAGQNILQSQLGYHAPQAQSSNETGPMKDAIALGLQPGSPKYAKYIRERTLKPTSQININNSGTPRPLTLEELETYNMPQGSYVTGRGSIEAPAPSRTSAGEAKQLGQGELANQMLNEIQSQLDTGNLNPSDPKTWLRAEGATIPIISNFINLTPTEAKTKSNISQLENLVLAMIRGAQVGPEEQKLFSKQLPQLGQDDELFKQNLTNTKRNIKTMMETMVKMRGLSTGKSDVIDTRVIGDVTWERIGEDPDLKSSWRRAN